jgi:2-amino-4-hydroxy-6-hydroxymethyldihydropteridine diphosphokinase
VPDYKYLSFIKMELIYLSLGSNLGHREQYLNEALLKIQSRIGELEKVSCTYESEAWGYSSENNFYNCCAALHTSIDPLGLMRLLLEIEQEMGRHREGRGYTDRVIDIDLLFYGNIQLDHSRLTLPHPSIGERKFVLAPLAEIAPDLIHPVTGISIIEMLQECTDPSLVTPLP